jgi:putative salt-induced outer membrane protein YdiY
MLLCVGLLGVNQSAWALEVYLTNGDKITGVVTHEDDSYITIKTIGDGEAKLNKASIDRPKTYPQDYSAPQNQTAAAQVAPATDIKWDKTLSLGYTKTGGNSRKDQGEVSATLNRKSSRDEWTAKYDAFYSSSENRLDAKKFYGLLRYAYSYGKDLKWYNFYKLEGDQDRSANIDYRFIPSIGRGYWFSNTDDLKAMAELGAGYQYTNFRDKTKPTGEAILTPRIFVDKRLINQLHLSEDLTMYPSLSELGEYRLRSETALTDQLSKRWALQLKLTDDFNSKPSGEVKKNDYTLITALNYKY